MELHLLDQENKAVWMGLLECDQRLSGLEETLAFICGDWARPGENARRALQGEIRVRC